MVLTYPGPLPEGALVRATKPASTGPLPPAPLWLDAGAGVTLSDTGGVLLWSAQTGAHTAFPVPANASGTPYEVQTLRFAAGENGGLVLPDAIPDLSSVSFAAILSPNLPDARTLLSLQAKGSDDYIFLSLEDMRLRVAQRGSDVELTMTLKPDSRVPLLILCTFHAGLVRLSVNGGTAVTGNLPIDPAAADLFIGCRNGRGGMKNKLGSFDLSDVLLWPGQDLPLAPTSLIALWEDRCRRGL